MKLLACILTLILPGVTAFGDDWPQWQGPDRNAISKETGLLQQWPAAGPPIAWRIAGLGGGDSAPAVANGKLFGMSNRDGKEIVWALSEADGQEVWVTSLGDAVEQRMPQSKEGPGCTPTVDGDRVFVIGMGGRLVCLNVEDGKILWQRSFTEDFGGVLPAWSYRESPLIDGDKLICTPGGPDALMVALNKQTGETIWKNKMPGDSGSPVASENPRRPERSNRPNRTAAADDDDSRRGDGSGGTSGESSTAIAGTKDSELSTSEHWGMTAFSQKVPNGKYLAKLYFAETYAGITEPGQRVFTFAVEGKEFKDFDIWKKADGPRRAYVESVAVEVTDGELKITFTPQVENPAIKAIEIIPQSKDPKDTKTIRINAGRSTAFTDSSGNVWQPDQGFEGGNVNPGTFVFGGRRGGGFSGGFGPGRGGSSRPGAAYASVIAINFEGQQQYVQLTSNALIGVAASDGKLLWQYDRASNAMGINCSTPIYRDGYVFAASAYGAGGGLLKLSKNSSGGIDAEEVYFTTRMQNHHGGMIVVDDCLYGANGGNGGGLLACLDFNTGEENWRDRQGPKGSLVFADGRLYLRSESGTMLLIEPNKEKLIVAGRFEQPDRSNAPAWAHPVIANGKLYVRDQNLLLCYDVQSK